MPAPVLTPDLVAQIRVDVAGGGSINGWAERLGVSWNAVAGAAYGHTWRSVTDPPPLAPPPSEVINPRPYARLTPEIVTVMRIRYREGLESYQSLAATYGVSEGAVRSAVLGHSWRHVPEPPVDRADVGGALVMTVEEEQEVVRLRASGLTYKAIAARMGHNTTTVFRTYKRCAGNSRGAETG